MPTTELSDDTFIQCDGPKCPARSYVHAELSTGELHYCAHHGTEYMEKLSKVALAIDDRRHLLTPKSRKLDAKQGAFA